MNFYDIVKSRYEIVRDKTTDTFYGFRKKGRSGLYCSAPRNETEKFLEERIREEVLALNEAYSLLQIYGIKLKK